jgi:hypothetical protein
MPRDGNGNWVPLSPVVGGTAITSAWANGLMTSFGQDVTESLDRNGRGGMLTSFTLVDGNAANPGWAFVTEPNTGMRRSDPGEVVLGILGTGVMRWQPNTAAIWTGSAWETIITSGTPGQVGVSPGTTDGDTLEWDTSGSGNWVVSPLKMVPVGGAADQTLRWDDTGSVWAVTSALSIDAAGAVDMTNTLSVVGVSTLGGVTLTGTFDGGLQRLTNVGNPADPQDAVTLAFADLNYALSTDSVSPTRTLTAGAGLTGGGDLTANRTFNVGGGDGIAVNADTVQVDDTVPRTAFAGGLNFVIDSGSPSGSDPNTIYFVT